MEFRRQWAIARRWFPLFLVFVVFASVPAYLLASRQPTVFEATAQLNVGQPQSGATSDTLVVRQQAASDWAFQAKLSPMLNHIIAAYGLNETADHLSGRLTISRRSGPSDPRCHCTRR